MRNEFKRINDKIIDLSIRKEMSGLVMLEEDYTEVLTEVDNEKIDIIDELSIITEEKGR